jgi:hypothetical protein
MPIEKPLPPLLEWLPLALLVWLGVVVALTAAAVGVGCLVAVLRRGPSEGFRLTRRTLAALWTDLVFLSPRRVAALAWLAVKESVRRRVVVVFAVFIVLLSFAGWFLDVGSIDPARLYLGFVLTATTYLVLLLVLFLSVFSLPADIRSRTLHTIVTKPVRASEIVLGRIVGFTIVGTGLLGLMSVVSFVFVLRGLDHVHKLSADSLVAASGPAGGKTGYTEYYPSIDPDKDEVTKRHHRHRVTVDAKGEARVEIERGHWHAVRRVAGETGDTYTLGGPEGLLIARVPVYGKLRFRNEVGADTERGINVGDEWMYRSFIAGGSQAAAVWTFQDITERKFGQGLPLEMNIEVFRTYKGDIEKGVFGSLALRNPRTGLTVEVDIFESKDFVISRLFIPREIKRFSSARMVSRKIDHQEGPEYIPPRDALDHSLADRKEFDLFQDLVSDGEVEIWLQCLEPSQYFGASQSDLYLRAGDAYFAVNFFKGYLGIWFQMVLVIGFGVMFSTFLSGPVAMLATTGALVGGFFRERMIELATGQAIGGGPFEALVRLVNQDNLTVELEAGLKTYLVQIADRVAGAPLWVFAMILPPFSEFSYSNWVAYGFDILWTPYVTVPLLRTLAFLVPVFVAGYFFLKTREVAR